MLSKRSLGYDADALPLARRCRENLGDLFLSNTVSADRAVTLARDAEAAGARGLSDIVRLSDTRSGGPAHRHRNLVRTFMKRSKWPSVYYADVRVMDKVTKEATTRSLPIMLPHEVAHCLRQRNPDVAKLCTVEGLDAMDEAQLRRVCEKSGVEYPSFLPLGLWMDGVACKWDRPQSLDLVVLCFPGWAGQWANARIPLVALEHRCW